MDIREDSHNKTRSQNASEILDLIDSNKLSLEEAEVLINDNENAPEKVREIIEKKYLN